MAQLGYGTLQEPPEIAMIDYFQWKLVTATHIMFTTRDVLITLCNDISETKLHQELLVPASGP